MIKFVVPRPVKKIHRTYTPIDREKRKIKIKFRFLSIKMVWIIFIVFTLIYGGFYALKNTILNHQYIIKRVLYDSGDVLKYDEPYLYKHINNLVKGENYHVIRFYKSKLLKSVKSEYPMVADLGIEYRSSNTVSIKLSFRPIDLVIRNQELRFAVVDDKVFAITTGNEIAQGARILDLPEYLSGLMTLSGIFYRQAAIGLVQQVELLYQGFPGLERIEYLPGGERSIIYLDKKKFYIYNLGDIPNQIKNYQLLKKYYKNYNQLADIDLGSLEKDKVIVRKF